MCDLFCRAICETFLANNSLDNDREVFRMINDVFQFMVKLLNYLSREQRMIIKDIPPEVKTPPFTTRTERIANEDEIVQLLKEGRNIELIQKISNIMNVMLYDNENYMFMTADPEATYQALLEIMFKFAATLHRSVVAKLEADPSIPPDHLRTVIKPRLVEAIATSLISSIVAAAHMLTLNKPHLSALAAEKFKTLIIQ